MSAKEIIRIGQIEVIFLLEGKDTNEQMAMFEFTVPSEARVPIPHSHEAYDEIVYGLEGVFTFHIDGKTVEIAKGETLFIPRGAVHGFNNLHTTPAKALCVVTPALIGPDFFKEAGALINAGGPPDMQQLRSIYAKWGLKPAVPGT